VAPIWAIKTLGIPAMRARFSWAVRIMSMFFSGGFRLNAFMSAPAEKNRSLALRTMTARAPSSPAAASTHSP
jgi:hypothetical protein